MSKLMVINPSKRGTKKRRKAVAKRKSKRRSTKSRRVTSTTTRKSVTKRYRRNPARRGMMGNIVGKNIMPSLAGGAGALAVDVGLAYLPVPAAMKAGPMSYVVKAGAAIAIGMLAQNFVRKETALNMTNGALTVVAYDAMKKATAQALPQIRMNAYDDYGMGAYLDTDDSMGAYMSPSLQIDDGSDMGQVFSDRGATFDVDYDEVDRF